MQYLHGVTFPNQFLTPKEWGMLFENVIDDGILRGFEVSASGKNVTISAGAVAVKGRIIVATGAVTEETNPTYADGYGRIKICINTANDSTSEIDHQTYVAVEYSSSSTFSALTQNDINGSGNLYEVELCTFQYSSSNISSITRTLNVVDSRQPKITYGTADPTGGQVGDIYIKYTE